MSSPASLPTRTPKVGKRQDWQNEAWDLWDATPEAKAAVLRAATQMSKVRFYPAVKHPSTGRPIPVDDPDAEIDPVLAAAAIADLEALRSPVGGQAELIRVTSTNFDVAGECWLVGEHVDPDPAAPGSTIEWQTYSVSELLVSSNGIDVETKQPRWEFTLKSGPGDQGRKLDRTRTTVIRLFTRSARWADLADCNWSSLLLVAEVLQACTALQASDAYSRMNAGLMTVPNELEVDDDAQQVDDDGNPIEPAEDHDPLLEDIDAAISEPIEDLRSASAHTPTLLRGPAEFLHPDALRLISFAKAQLDKLDERIERLVMRVARGLNQPVEATTGLQETTFANAAQVNEDEWEKYLQPRAEAIGEAWTYGYHRPNLLDQGYPADQVSRIFIWHDWSDLRRDPDPREHAKEAHESLVLSDAGYRGYLGIPDDLAPSPEEYLIRLASKGVLPPELLVPALRSVIPDLAPEVMPTSPAQQAAAALLFAAGALDRGPGTVPATNEGLLSIVRDLVAERRASAAIETRATPVALAAASSPTPIGSRLVAIDRELRSRLAVAAEAAMARALDRAGNRLRSATQGDTALRARVPRGTAGRYVADLLGRAVVASSNPGDLWDGAWDDLETQFLEWGALAGADALDAAAAVASGISGETRRQLQLRQADDIATAWTWMRDALTAVADARLFDPDPQIPPIGEFDPSARVPTGLVRRAMSIAGGRTDLAVDASGSVLDAGAWVAMPGPGTGAPGGIGTGTLVTEAIGAAGGSIEGYRWVYGPALRAQPFPAHQALAGVEFVNFDDAALANVSGFPAVSFYFPGDHAGCVCDVEPIIIDPTSTT